MEFSSKSRDASSEVVAVQLFSLRVDKGVDGEETRRKMVKVDALESSERYGFPRSLFLVKSVCKIAGLESVGRLMMMLVMKYTSAKTLSRGEKDD